MRGFTGAGRALRRATSSRLAGYYSTSFVVCFSPVFVAVHYRVRFGCVARDSSCLCSALICGLWSRHRMGLGSDVFCFTSGLLFLVHTACRAVTCLFTVEDIRVGSASVIIQHCSHFRWSCGCRVIRSVPLSPSLWIYRP